MPSASARAASSRLTQSICLHARRQLVSRSSSARGQRLFHSYDHTAKLSPFGNIEKAILAAAYRYVPEHGFSQTALRHGARDTGYLDISPSALPEGIFSLIQYHLVTQRQNLVSRECELSKDNDRLDINSRIVALTWDRLLGNQTIIHQWQEALAVMAQPSYAAASLKEMALLSDEIWFLAGDTSVDPSWYTKRAGLSMIYSTSELYMTNDKSPGFHDTRNFLHRRMDEAKIASGVFESIRQWTGFTFNAGVNVLRSKGVHI